MKSRTKTWEVIAAGCAFIVFSAYLFNPTATPADIHQVKQIHIEIPHIPEAPHAPGAVSIDVKKLDQLEKLKELKHLEKELQKVEKELEEVSIQLDMDLPSLSTLKGLPKVLITSS